MQTYKDNLKLKALECGVPEHCVDGLINYISDRIPPGGFLEALLSNDLAEACGRADEINKHRLYEYMTFLYNHAPGLCWGNPGRVYKWLDRESEEKAG